jgi:enoyl-CoA hydratase/carnithine racemase
MTIQWINENNIGLLTIDQPPANTMSMEFFREFRLLMKHIQTIPRLKAIIISGIGRHYSSGADIGELLDHVDYHTMLENYRSFQSLEQLNVPVISAIRGVCLGSALELALFSHFRICVPDSVLGLPESTYNLIPGIGGIQQIAKLAGKANAISLLLSGNTFSGTDALQMGIADGIVAKDKLMPVALKFAGSLPGDIQWNDRKILIYKYLKPLLADA